MFRRLWLVRNSKRVPTTKPHRRATLATAALVALLVSAPRLPASAQPVDNTGSSRPPGQLTFAPDASPGSVSGAYSDGAHFSLHRSHAT